MTGMENEGIIRLGIFFGLFAVFALAEAMKPRRKRNLPRAGRWVTNWSISILNTVTTNLMAIVLPALAIGAAMDAEAQGWGLFNRWGIEGWIEVVLVVLVFDFAIWLQHLVTHKIPILWRLHRVHHSVIPRETNRNFGFNLPWWDRLFGSYRDQPEAGHESMQIGLKEYPELKWSTNLISILLMPFRSGKRSPTSMCDAIASEESDPGSP